MFSVWCVCTHILFIHSSIDGYLSFFPNILAIVNNSTAFRYIFSSWIWYHMLVLCFILEGSIILFFIVAASFFISSSNTLRLQFLHILTKTYFLVLFYFAFNYSHLNGVKGYLVVLTCTSLMISEVNTFSCAYWLYYFQKCLFKPSRPLLIFKLSYLPFCCWIVKVPYI